MTPGSREHDPWEPGAGHTQKSPGVGAGSKWGGSRELDNRKPGASTPSVTPLIHVMRVCVNMDMCVRVCMCACTCKCACVCTCVCVYTYVYKHA
jgi:hypothetical protein